MDDTKLLVDAVLEAGEIGLRYFKKDPEVWIKGEDSPVSAADLAIDQFLKETLLKARPDYGWLSEESEDDKARLRTNRVFVVDPIDGTRGFLQETENWMVSVALVEAGKPLYGVLYGPVMDRLYVAAKGQGATMNGKILGGSHLDGVAYGDFAMPSRLSRHVEKAFGQPVTLARYIHSLAYRMALVASGELAATIAKPHAHDWDVAAADLILQEAGAGLFDIDGKAPSYNRNETEHGWLIAADKALFQPLQEAVLQAIDLEKA